MKIAATGHRPNKLAPKGLDPYSDRVLHRLTALACSSLEVISRRSKCKVSEVISGMALGWDTAIALSALESEIPLIAMIPFDGQESRWSQQDQRRYLEILEQCQDIVYVCDPGYASWKMQQRNKEMVNRCDLVLALWDGSEGGTGNCVKYAESQGRSWVNVFGSWMKGRGL